MSNMEHFISNNEKITTWEYYLKMEHSVIDAHAKLNY
jgi:hypothetical protein